MKPILESCVKSDRADYDYKLVFRTISARQQKCRFMQICASQNERVEGLKVMMPRNSGTPGLDARRVLYVKTTHVSQPWFVRQLDGWLGQKWMGASL